MRAWFNMGLANYVRGGQRLLPCRVVDDVFFVDPFGDVKPCNAMDLSLGSLKRQSFDEIMGSAAAGAARRQVAACDRHCWMIGSVAPAMKRQTGVPGRWAIQAKLNLRRGEPLPPVRR